jgi:hypothetical protein
MIRCGLPEVNTLSELYHASSSKINYNKEVSAIFEEVTIEGLKVVK